MKIGIDISQMAYPGTGVARYVEKLVEGLVSLGEEHEYVLFFASLRKEFQISNFKFLISNKNVKIKNIKLPPSVLDLLWNRLHVLPIESLIGDVDLFITSDWTEPPSRRAKKATILYDLIVYKFPDETDKKIIQTQKRKLAWVKRESDVILCISESTKKDAMEILGIEEKRLKVIGAGV
jgi:glycosyltransferase involved in cell wall biosynthesis